MVNSWHYRTKLSECRLLSVLTSPNSPNNLYNCKHQGPVVQNPINTNPGLTLNKTNSGEFSNISYGMLWGQRGLTYHRAAPPNMTGVAPGSKSSGDFPLLFLDRGNFVMSERLLERIAE